MRYIQDQHTALQNPVFSIIRIIIIAYLKKKKIEREFCWYTQQYFTDEMVNNKNRIE